MRKLIFNVLILFAIICSCNSYNPSELTNVGEKNKARINVINDFSKTEKSKKHMVYEIWERDESNNLFSFSVFSMINKKYYPQEEDSIGSISKRLPTQFKEINKKLFVWDDSTIVISKEIIQKLHEYKMIDSTIFKIKKGQLSEDYWPILSSDDSKKSVHYFICKKNISKFKKIESAQKLPVEKYPVINCD